MRFSALDKEDNTAAIVIAVLIGLLIGLLSAGSIALCMNGIGHYILNLFGPFKDVPDIQRTHFMDSLEYIWLLLFVLQFQLFYWINFILVSIVSSVPTYLILAWAAYRILYYERDKWNRKHG